MNSRNIFLISLIFSLSLIAAGCGGGGGGGGSGGRGGGGGSSADDLDKFISLVSSDLARSYADPVRSYVYVTDNAQNSVHFLNTDSYEIELSIAVGSNPTMMDMKTDGSLLFVMLSGGSQIAVVDLVAQSLLTNINVPGTPNSIAVGANNLLYVSLDGSSDLISIFDISSLPAMAAGTLAKGSLGIIISGRSYDRTKLYTHDLSTSLSLTQWDISGVTPIEIQSADIASGPPIITTSPDNTIFTITPNLDSFGTSFPNYDGDVPFHRMSDLLKAGTVNVEWSAVAVGISPTSGRALVAHNDELVNSIAPVDQRHDRNSKDLHIFDLLTYLEIGRYTLRDHVKRNGITHGPDGRIYLLLGTRPDGFFPGELVTAKAIGVITP